MKIINGYGIAPIPASEQKYKISVCVAVYNSRDYLRRSIDSVLNQTYKNLEIILVDDGSSDGSEKICDEIANSDTRVIVIHKPNGGLFSSRNVGIEAATGDYICFLDGDDYIDPDMYESMLSVLLSENVDLVACRYRQVFADGVYDLSTDMIALFDGQEMLEQFLKEDEAFLIQNSAWNKLYKRSLISELRFPERWYEDMLYTTHLLALPEHSVYIDRAFHNYICDRGTSIMNMGINKRIFTDLIPNLIDRAAFLDSIDRHDLALISDYFLIKKSLEFVTTIYRSKDELKKEHLEFFDSLIRSYSSRFEEIFGISFANQNVYRKLKIYMFSPLAYHIFMRLNDSVVLPVKMKIRKGGN